MSKHGKGCPRIAVYGLVTAAVCALTSISAPGAGARKSAEYWNQRWNFCVAYPASWDHTEPFDGSGVELKPAADSDGTITVSALPTQASRGNPSRVQTPLEGIESGLSYIRSHGAHDMKVERRHRGTFLGHESARVTFTYRSQDGVYWLAKEVDFSTPSGVTFHLGLKVPPEEGPIFAPVFAEISRSLRLNCR